MNNIDGDSFTGKKSDMANAEKKCAKIVIVDDSPFAIALIRDILESNGFEIAGTAVSLNEVRKVVGETKPDLVTMDISLPGEDGLECTRIVREIDENIKVIIVSSMMDDELVEKAKKIGVSAYIQKPVEAEELVATVNRVIAADGLYQFLRDEQVNVFKESLKSNLHKMTKASITYKDEYPFDKEFKSMGMDFIVGIVGKFSGRMLLDLSGETAGNLVAAVLKRQPKDNDETAVVMGEFANIVSGSACSALNKKNKALGLRVSPPSTLSGKDFVVSPPDFPATTIVFETDFGELLLNIGFKRGEVKWM